VATKTCPECGAEAPTSAARCKECFHDFTDARPPKAGPIVLLAALAAMSLLGAVTFWLVTMRPLEERILVDERTEAVIFTTHYRTGPKTDRLEWGQIGSLEHVTTAAGEYQIVAVTLSGDRRVIQESEESPLRGMAEKYASLMEKPLSVVDNTRGFHKMREGE
jgi:ribosomal protein L40E